VKTQTITIDAAKVRSNLINALLLVLGTTAFICAGNARAELRCDCTQIVETCSAEVSFDGDEIEVASDSDACSRVDYLIDGQPFSALVVDGEAEFDWRGQPQSSPEIVVENCRVCADSSTGNSIAESLSRTPNESSADDEAGPKAIVKVLPNYPRKALTKAIEGTVTVEFSVTDEGVVQNIRVVESSNSVFITPAIDATSRFRYAPLAITGIRETFTFRLLDGVEPTVTSITL
jgi:TonB family protein